jgi:DNA-binding CsgD family transcriptional regulator
LRSSEPIIKAHGDNILLKDLNEYYYELYSGKKEFEKALFYFQKYTSIQDSIFNQEIRNKIASLNIKYETAKKEAENIRLKSELDIKQITQNRLTIIIIIISLLFGVIIVAFFYIWKYLKQKQTISKQESMLLSERLEHSIQEVASKALHLASQNEFRAKLLVTTNEVYDRLDETGKERIKSLLRNLESNIDQNAWHEFETRFEQVHETFFYKLNALFPDLTQNDRRICAFLKLNMSTKDIALLTHRSPRSIESARYRLKKKFGLGVEEDILHFLQSI